MGHKLRRLVNKLKDKASLTKATIISPSSSSANIAVLRATSRRHPTSPPHPDHISALLSFGNHARPLATALSSSLSSRLLSTRDPSVALKSLLSLHHLLRSAPFILLDSLFSSLLPNPSGRFTRSPLLLSSFPLGSNPSSWSLSTIVRWYSTLLELRLILPQPSSDDITDWVSSLLTPHLIAELDVLVKFFVSAFSPPEMPAGNRLAAEVKRMVEDDGVAAENAILARIQEVGERIGQIGFADAVELVLVLRRLDECRPSDGRSTDEKFWMEVRVVRGIVEEIAVKGERDARVVRRDQAVWFSDRFGVRTGEIAPFGSNRFVLH